MVTDAMTLALLALDESLKYSESEANADTIWPTGEVEATVNVTMLRMTVAGIMGMWKNRLLAIQALGAMPEGYCFCSKDRIGDDSKHHEPECRDIRSFLFEVA